MFCLQSHLSIVICRMEKFLQTKRLYLRDYTADDFAAIHEYANSPEFCQYVTFGPNSESDTKNFIHEALLKSLHMPRYQFDMAIILNSTNELIGGANIERDGEQSKVGNIGYGLNTKFQKQGYAVEIATALISYGFENLGLLVIYATCDTRNTPSYAVMEKCGMKRVCKITADRTSDDKSYDSYRYEIYAHDYFKEKI